MIAKAAHPEANIIWGAAFDDSYEDEMKITVIATGFDDGQRSAVDINTGVSETAGASAGPNGVDDDDFGKILEMFNKR